MATPELICNLALANIQIYQSIVDLATDSTKEGKVCRLWYDTSLAWMLEDYDWNFARRRVAAALVSSTQIPDYFTYAYAYPSDALKIRKIEVPGVRTPYSDQRIRFEPAGENSDTGDYKVIYTNQINAILVYTKNITDAGLFPNKFAVALSWLVAANISGPLAAKGPLSQMAQQQSLITRFSAIESDLKEVQEDAEPMGETERARL